MQCLEVNSAVGLIYRSLGVKGLRYSNWALWVWNLTSYKRGLHDLCKPPNVDKVKVKVKVKLYHYRPITGPKGSRRLRFTDFHDSWHIKLVRLSPLCTGRLYR